MAKTRVFISHATKGDDAFKPVRAVCEELSARGFEAEFDQMILKPSDDWYDRVNLAMAQCDAAILLVDRHAAESDYVKYEAAVLGNRWHAEKNLQRPFVLFIALVDPDPVVNDTLGSAHLLQVLGRAPKLDRTQRWKPDRALLGDPDLGPLATALADAFQDRHGPPWTDETPLALARHSVMRALADFVALSGKTVLSALDRLKTKNDNLRDLFASVDALPEKNHAEYLAFWLADTAAAAPRDMARVMRALGRDIKLLDAGKRQLLCENLFVLHSLWVANENCPIGKALKGRDSQAIALNGEPGSQDDADRYTISLYPAHRLFRSDYEVYCYDKDASEAAEIADAFADAFDIPEKNGLAPFSTRHQRKVRRKLEDVCHICVLPQDFAAPHRAPDLTALQAKFDGVVFIVPTGQDLDAADIDANVIRLVPPVDLDQLDDALSDWKDTKEAITETL